MNSSLLTIRSSTARLRTAALGLFVITLAAFSFAQQPQNQAPSGGLPDPAKLPALKFKEEKVGNYENALVKVEGFVSGSSFTINDEFTTKYEHKPPSVPFKIIVPKSKNVLVIPGGKKSGLPEFVKAAGEPGAELRALPGLLGPGAARRRGCLARGGRP